MYRKYPGTRKGTTDQIDKSGTQQTKTEEVPKPFYERKLQLIIIEIPTPSDY